VIARSLLRRSRKWIVTVTFNWYTASAKKGNHTITATADSGNVVLKATKVNHTGALQSAFRAKNLSKRHCLTETTAARPERHLYTANVPVAVGRIDVSRLQM